jgi:predicted RNase H-like nuclease (RuvC/YqgF family)
MNKKVIASAVIIVIVAASIATWLVNNQISELQSQNSDLQNQISELQDQINELQNQNSELQNQLNELENINAAHDVKIAAFEWVGDYHSLGQVNLFQNYKVTIQNMGDNNASGLYISVKLLSTGTKATMEEHAGPINTISAGQIMEISGSVSVGYVGSYVPTAVGEVTLTVGDVLLDQQTRNLQGSFP